MPQVQSKVGLKYDAWHKEVVSKFGNMLGSEMVEFHGQVSKVISAFANMLLCFLLFFSGIVVVLALSIYLSIY